MLAQSHDEVVDLDALLDLCAATARLAVKDYQAGPDAVGQRHYESARAFLDRLGVLERVHERYGLEEKRYEQQLSLFT